LLISELSKILKTDLIGDRETKISGVCSPDNPSPNCICYLLDIKKFNSEIISNASAILTTEEIFKKIDIQFCYLITKNLNDSVITLHEQFLPPYYNFSNSSHLTLTKENLYSDFYFGDNSTYGSGCSFGVNVVIENNVKIGENVSLGHGVVIHKNCTIGNNVKIGSGCVIGSEGFGNFRLDDFSWGHIPHIGSVVIKNNVAIGSNCTIDRGTIEDTIIHDGVKLDNQIHIAHNVHIGENTAIAANVGIAGSCKIGKRNMIGGMVGIIDHITTTDDVTISATSAVTQNLKEPGVYTGIMPISKHSLWKRIALWITKLDKIAKLLGIKKI